MSMTKTELRPEEGEPEEQGETRNPVEDRKDVRALQAKAWEEGVKSAQASLNPYRPLSPNPYKP